MTWNVKTRNFGSDDWNKVVGTQEPDIVGLQEICVREAEDLRKLLKEKYKVDYNLALGSVREGRYPGCDPVPGLRGAYGQALLSRYPITDAVNVALPDDERVDEPRGYMAVTVDIPGYGKTRVFNTHIAVGSSKGDSEEKLRQRAAVQERQLRAIADATAEHPLAMVLGDLNVRPDNIALEPFNRAGFADADRANPPQPTSNNLFNKRDSAAAFKIDYILLRGFEPAGGAETYWVASSDHRPLLTNLA